MSASAPNTEAINSIRGRPPESPTPRTTEDGQTVLVDLTRLRPCRYQRRTVMPDRVRQLAETIRQNGLLQNVTVRPVAGDPDHDYEIIAGHRRTEAFRKLLAEASTPEERERWSRVPCTVRLGLTEVQVAALAAIENLERDDGDPLEQALSLLEVKKAGRFDNNAQVAEATGMGLQRVSRLLRLAEAPEVMQKAVTPGVFVELTDKDGTTRNQHVKLEPSVVLAIGPYFRHQEGALGRAEAASKTERLLQRVARGRWPRLRVEAEVKRLLGSRKAAETEQEPDACDTVDELAAIEPSPASERKQLYRDKGVQFVIFTRNLKCASETERRALLERLRSLVQQLEASPPSTTTGPST